ncbi:hypothetical protein L3X38_036069 [Prunus dulcis]|uniref:Uncharacterized protein n=1 Tax=Prunus dulcis TaxID=3755 RepID=A0AAD4V2H5_PRUDU|nr:hypothetical protein L3X38_036069 [Prunus dulcis]
MLQPTGQLLGVPLVAVAEDDGWKEGGMRVSAAWRRRFPVPREAIRGSIVEKESQSSKALPAISVTRPNRSSFSTVEGNIIGDRQGTAMTGWWTAMTGW